MASSKASFPVRTFPRGSLVSVPYRGRGCDGTVLEHASNGTVRVVLHTVEEGNNVINWYEFEALKKVP